VLNERRFLVHSARYADIVVHDAVVVDRLLSFKPAQLLGFVT